MGGAGAAKWGFKFTDTFGAVSILAGALHDADSLQRRGGSFQEIYGGSRKYFEGNSPWTLVRKNDDAIRGSIFPDPARSGGNWRCRRTSSSRRATAKNGFSIAGNR